jgi:hypothetical protein
LDLGNDDILSFLEEDEEMKALRKKNMEAEAEKKLLENKILLDKWKVESEKWALEKAERMVCLRQAEAALGLGNKLCSSFNELIEK